MLTHTKGAQDGRPPFLSCTARSQRLGAGCAEPTCLCRSRDHQLGRVSAYDPVGFAFDGERFLIQSGSGTRKVRNIQLNPRVRVLVQSPAQAMGEDGWVAADGTAHIVDGDEAQRLNWIANDRYLTDAGRAVYDEVMAPIMDVTIVVTPERWQTWTDSMMFEPILERGYTEAEAASWFLQPDH